MTTRPKALLFFHDGSGLGHLRRISRVTEALQETFSCLVLAGMREAHEVIPRASVLVTLPSWDDMFPHRARRVGRSAWWSGSREESLAFRTELIVTTVKKFSPDLIVVDYLPFGQYGELAGALKASGAVKYLLLRGVIDSSDKASFSGDAADEISECFDRVVLAVDRAVIDVVQAHSLRRCIADRCVYVGYVAPSKPTSINVRRRLSVPDGAVWVVCSAGGGRNADDLMRRCVALSFEFPEVCFDIVAGPRSFWSVPCSTQVPPNCRVKLSCSDLPEMNGSADVVICCGGYNTVCEAMVGGAHLLVHPNQSGLDDEQVTHAKRLSSHYPIHLVDSLPGLDDMLRVAIDRGQSNGRPAAALDFGGCDAIRHLAERDVLGHFTDGDYS